MPEMQEHYREGDMHSEAWWIRALEGALTLEEAAAWDTHLTQCTACREQWDALLALDSLLEATPPPAPPSDFAARTLTRWEATRRRHRLWSLVGGILLLGFIIGIELLVFGALYYDVTRVATALLASQDILLQALMRMSVGLVAFSRTLAPYALAIAGLAFFLALPNGMLATFAVVMLRRQRALVGVR